MQNVACICTYKCMSYTHYIISIPNPPYSPVLDPDIVFVWIRFSTVRLSMSINVVPLEIVTVLLIYVRFSPTSSKPKTALEFLSRISCILLACIHEKLNYVITKALFISYFWRVEWLISWTNTIWRCTVVHIVHIPLSPILLARNRINIKGWICAIRIHENT